MKTARDIVNYCFFHGHRIGYENHKHAIQDLNAKDEQFNALLEACKMIRDCMDGPITPDDMLAKVKQAIAKAEDNHAQTDNQTNIIRISGVMLMSKIFPTAIIVLNLLASAVWLYAGDGRKCVYFLCAAVLTITVTY